VLSTKDKKGLVFGSPPRGKKRGEGGAISHPQAETKKQGRDQSWLKGDETWKEIVLESGGKKGQSTFFVNQIPHAAGWEKK